VAIIKPFSLPDRCLIIDEIEARLRDELTPVTYVLRVIDGSEDFGLFPDHGIHQGYGPLHRHGRYVQSRG